MCGTQYWDTPRGRMPFNDFTRILAQFRNLRVRTLNGLGEPLLNPDLSRMVAHASARGIAAGFNSNATLLDASWRHNLIQAGLRWRTASVDGACK